MPTIYGTFVALCANVPLDPQYEHTLSFTDTNDQLAYFDTLRVATYVYRDISYQRYNSGTIRLEATMDALNEVNYMYFDNVQHEHKRYYAFITDMRYINESTIEIDYSIDHLQTWWLDININPCFVEREHVNDDTIGINTVPEGLETGEYVCTDYEYINEWPSSQWDSQAGGIVPINTGYLIVASQKPNGDSSFSYLNGIDSAVHTILCGDRAAFLSALDSYVNGLTRNLSPILAIYLIPSTYYNQISDGSGTGVSHALTKVASAGYGPFKCFCGVWGGSVGQSYRTYTPRNNKLYTYPYNFLTFESPDGNSVNLAFEKFANKNSISFTSYMAVYPDQEIMCWPNSYESNATAYGQRNYNLKYALFTKNIPTVPVTSDQFAAWWAQNKYSMPFAAPIIEGVNAARGKYGAYREMGFDPISSGLGTAGNFLMGAGKQAANPAIALQLGGKAGKIASDYLGMGWKEWGHNAIAHDKDIQVISDIATEIGQELAAVEGHKAVPDTLQTKGGNAGALHGIQHDCFKVFYTKIKPEFAEIIDNYFTCYGYACKRVKIPNIYGRLNWNYVKTKGCTLNTNLPTIAEKAICDIFDNGITIWHNPSTIHNYANANPIV